MLDYGPRHPYSEDAGSTPVPHAQAGTESFPFLFKSPRDGLGRLNQADPAGKKFQAFLPDSQFPSPLMDVPPRAGRRGSLQVCVPTGAAVSPDA